MKLYYASSACSLSPHIVSREEVINLDLEQVDNRFAPSGMTSVISAAARS
jgi:hypothetical protein